MTAIAYTQFRKRIAEITESAIENQEAIQVTRADGRDFYIVPAELFRGLDETAYLLSTEANRAALRESMAEAERGEFVTRPLQ